MAYETIIVEREDHVETIKLNRPDALNALNDTLLSELGDALTAAQANEKVRCIVLTGSEKAFAAGADITTMRDKTLSMCFTRICSQPKSNKSNAFASRLSRPFQAMRWAVDASWR